MTQRDKMRELYRQHEGDKSAVVKAYAAAEQAGEVNRLRNASGYGTEQYAQALWSDGEKKGWLAQNKAVPSVQEIKHQPPSLMTLQEQVPAAEVPKDVHTKPALEEAAHALQRFEYIPDHVMKLYEEAVKAMNAAMPVSCAAVLRTMIEAICVDKGVVDGVVDKTFFNRFVRSDNLKGKINGLVETGLTTQSHADVLHLIRLLSNDAVHRAEVSERALLAEAIEIVESLIYTVYELPNKITKFPSRAK